MPQDASPAADVPPDFSETAAKKRLWRARLLGGLKKTAVVIAVLAVLVLLQKFLPLQDWLKNGTRFYRGLGLWGVLLFLLTYVACALCFVPGPTLSLTAGTLYGFAGGYAVTITGAVIAAATARLLARSLLHARAKKWASGYSSFQALEAASRDGRGWRVMLLIHLSPVLPLSLANYLMSLTSLRLYVYLAGNAIGLTPGILFYSYVGTLGDRFALRGTGLHARDVWTFGVARVLLWGIGIAATTGLAILIRNHSRKTLKKA